MDIDGSAFLYLKEKRPKFSDGKIRRNFCWSIKTATNESWKFHQDISLLESVIKGYGVQILK